MLVNESLGVFEGQYELADEVTNACMEAIENGEREVYVECDGMSFKGVHCVIVRNQWGFGGKIWKIGEDGSIWIEVSYDGRGGEKRNREGIKDAVVHELMHGHIFSKRISNGEEPFDTCELYDVCAQLINNPEADDTLYRFAYAIYSSYYQESQSIVSQSLGQVMSKLRDGLKLVDAIKETAAFDIFSGNIDMLKKVVDMNDAVIKKQIILPISELYGVETTPSSIRKICSKAIVTNNESIKDLSRTAMLSSKKSYQ